jgi:hypothetical protein
MFHVGDRDFANPAVGDDLGPYAHTLSYVRSQRIPSNQREYRNNAAIQVVPKYDESDYSVCEVFLNRSILSLGLPP